MVRRAACFGPGADDERLGNAARRSVRPQRLHDHSRHCQWQCLHKHAAAQRLVGKSRSDLSQPGSAISSSLLCLLSLDQGHLRRSRGHAYWKARVAGMAAGKVSGPIGELLSGYRYIRSSQHLSLHHQQPSRRHPGQEAQLLLSGRSSGSCNAQCRRIRGDGRAGGSHKRIPACIY
ncbi:MAG: hypothetical protein A4E49_00399 [Methanosaeta sp. PtaU1.Bin112]|nr:MAG: hypothetical protein A4E49_00399 [Methanosaeta sp. PtaU1.Bin112]